MAIDITGVPNSQTHNAGDKSPVSVGKDEATAPQQETGKPSTTDTVSMTDAAQRLQSLETSLESLPIVDSQRVETIRAAIADGEYEIDPEKVAEKLTSFEVLLHGNDE
ncbi:MAG: flagellar biosynthesis anti-sigma factor FlgM [Acidiferrobacterales bacterium]